MVTERDDAGMGAGSAAVADLVSLLFASNLIEAEFFKSLLEEHGVPALIETENSEVAGIPALSAGVPVLVPAELYDEAVEILAAKRRGGEDDDFDEDFEEEDEEAEEEDELDEYEDEDFDDFDDEDEEEVFYDDEDEDM